MLAAPFPHHSEVPTIDEEIVEKTELEKSRDIVSQLKEIEHYPRANIEKLTAHWLKLDGELKQPAIAKALEALLTHQNTFHDALEKTIHDYEAVCAAMTP